MSGYPPYYPQPNQPMYPQQYAQPPKRGASMGLVIVLGAVAGLLAIAVAIFAVLAFRGSSTPTPPATITVTSTVTADLPTPAQTGLDGTYTVNLDMQTTVQIMEDPVGDPGVMANFTVLAASVTVAGPIVTLTMTQLCYDYETNEVCLDQVPVVWTGQLAGNSAKVSDADWAVLWVTVTIDGSQATLSRPDGSECTTATGEAVGELAMVGDVHYQCNG